uniref:Uncharacterized protein n=1 Tax=uncultured Nocardioidaceae bacterium TaxID=253824 RepID=A0A6J4LRF0_9ACTN|nr:MAG: hypothetical protein AVDCRST_MAG46-1689 [uncultured Nocardioidaceae bacterium]
MTQDQVRLAAHGGRPLTGRLPGHRHVDAKGLPVVRLSRHWRL